MTIYKAIRTALGKAFMGDTYLAKALPLSSPDIFDDRLIMFLNGLHVLDEPRILPGPAIEGADIRSLFTALHPTSNPLRIAAIEAMLKEPQSRDSAIASAFAALEAKLASVSIPLGVAHAVNMHSADVVQPLDTMVAAGSYIKVRPLDSLWKEFEVTLDLKFNSDTARSTYAAALRFPLVSLDEIAWGTAFNALVETYVPPNSMDVPFNGHLCSLLTSLDGGIAGYLCIFSSTPTYYYMGMSRTWDDVLGATSANRLIGSFRIGGI